MSTTWLQSGSGRTVVLTGATGFIGRRLLTRLATSGVTVLTPRSPSELAAGQDFDGVFHLAGKSDLRECQDAPRETFESNIALTFDWLERATRSRSRFFVLASSGLLYGDQLSRGAVESDSVHARNLYLASKLASEALVESYSLKHGWWGRSARLSNVYGPGSATNTVIGTLCDQLKRERRARLRALEPVRDFLFIDDAVDALLRMADRPEGSAPGYEALNTGSGRGISIADLASIACKLVDLSVSEAVQGEAPVSGRASANWLDHSRLSALTGWVPRVGIEEGLRKVIHG